MHALIKPILSLLVGILALAGGVAGFIGISFYIIEVSQLDSLRPSSCTVLNKEIVPDLCIQEVCGCHILSIII